MVFTSFGGELAIIHSKSWNMEYRTHIVLSLPRKISFVAISCREDNETGELTTTYFPYNNIANRACSFIQALFFLNVWQDNFPSTSFTVEDSQQIILKEQNFHRWHSIIFALLLKDFLSSSHTILSAKRWGFVTVSLRSILLSFSLVWIISHVLYCEERTFYWKV